MYFQGRKSYKRGAFFVKGQLHVVWTVEGKQPASNTSSPKKKYVETNEFIFSAIDIVCWNCQITKKYQVFSSLGRWSTGKMYFLNNFLKDIFG